jgi:hypothetical protein
MPPDSQSAADYEIDEALWAAYRRHDKSAVTKTTTSPLSQCGDSGRLL